MFCSTIIPTIGRDTLGRTVYSVLDQTLDGDACEVIVVNDSGQPLPPAGWRDTPRVRVIDTCRRERSIARNTGAAVARGRYLHFLDDDDILLPGAMTALWQTARQHDDALWIYGSWRTVNNQGTLVDEFSPELNGNVFSLLVSGESLPLQASIIRALDFFAVGGFDNHPELIGVEDRELGRRLALRGAVAHADRVVAQVRIGEETSTTDWGRTAERDRLGRERALAMEQAFRRLWESTRGAYWSGRVSRAFVASAAWNVRRGNLPTAATRALSGVAIARLNLLVPDYWRGLRTKIR